MPDIDYFDLNRKGWDRRAEIHYRSKFYDVKAFLNGETSLREIELAALPSVAGKRLLHLQCHFGLDTLSWVRRGAICTGVDISPVAIGLANRLATEAGLEADFVCANIYDFQPAYPETYAIVFTSYGAVCWLSDLVRWAAVIASNLAAGGIFYMVEFHPFHDLLSGYSYFEGAVPDVEEEGSYTENGGQAVARLATWAHPISSIVTALIDSGIEILSLKEFPFSPYNCFDGLEEREPGRFYLCHLDQDVPIVFSLMGRKMK